MQSEWHFIYRPLFIFRVYSFILFSGILLLIFVFRRSCVVEWIYCKPISALSDLDRSALFILNINGSVEVKDLNNGHVIYGSILLDFGGYTGCKSVLIEIFK